MSTVSINRRQFLFKSGWTLGGLTVLSSCSLIPALPSFSESKEEESFTWIQMLKDGSVNFFLPRSEIGQGIDRSLSQVVADELALPLQRVLCIYPTTRQIKAVQMTVGSQSIENYYQPIRNMTRLMYQQLTNMAAAQLGTSKDDLTLKDGVFTTRDNKSLDYAELLSESKPLVLDANKANIKQLAAIQSGNNKTDHGIAPAAQFKQDRQLVRGALPFSRDIYFDDMAFGGVSKPAWWGAKLLAFDEQAALTIAGVMKIVLGPDKEPGLVAKTPMALSAGMKALNCQWSIPTEEELREIESPLDIETALAKGMLDHTPVNEGDAARYIKQGELNHQARFDTPHTAHAQMEPRSGVARVQEGLLEVWTGSQDPWFVQSAVAKATGWADSKVIVHNQRAGGAFGGRLLCQASIEAAWLAAAVDYPVKVQWSREEEFRYNYTGAQFSHQISAGLDKSGNITAWHHQMVGSPILTSSAFFPSYLHWVANLITDAGTWRGTELPYEIRNHRIDFGDIRTPAPTGAWRGLGAAPNTFAVECMMDELAEKAGTDPLDFRIKHAAHPRFKQTIERLAQRVRPLKQWSGANSEIGIATTVYKEVTYVAVAAEIAMQSNQPVVRKIWCVHDCGQMINADRVRAQIEGNLIWGVSMALYEDYQFRNGLGSTDNFDSYPICRMSDAPEIIIDMIASDEAPSGAGEAAFAPTAAAIINGFSRLRGERIRKLPIKNTV